MLCVTKIAGGAGTAQIMRITRFALKIMLTYGVQRCLLLAAGSEGVFPVLSKPRSLFV